MPDLTYLKLRDDVGIAPSHIVNDAGLEVENPRAGELDALNNIGIQIPMPTMIGTEVGMTTRRVEIKPGAELADPLRARIIPGTRIVETDAPAVINLLVASGDYAHCDPPASERPRKPKQPTTDQGE